MQKYRNMIMHTTLVLSWHAQRVHQVLRSPCFSECVDVDNTSLVLVHQFCISSPVCVRLPVLCQFSLVLVHQLVLVCNFGVTSPVCVSSSVQCQFTILVSSQSASPCMVAITWTNVQWKSIASMLLPAYHKRQLNGGW